MLLLSFKLFFHNGLDPDLMFAMVISRRQKLHCFNTSSAQKNGLFDIFKNNNKHISSPAKQEFYSYQCGHKGRDNLLQYLCIG